MSLARPTFDEVNQAARANLPGLLAHWLPGGKRQAGEWVVRNPTRADNRAGSFRVNMRTGKWADFATNDRGGDPVSLYAYLNGCANQGDACDAVAQEVGIAPGEAPARSYVPHTAPKAAQEDPWQPILPVPADAPELTPEVAARFATNGFRFTATWDYHNDRGELLCHVIRFDRPPNGVKAEKEVVPVTFCAGPNGRRAWHKKALPEPRALYGLPRLASEPETDVLVVEGEKTADAAADLFPHLVVVTSPGGSKAASKADWTLLAGRRVAIWPDHDLPGKDYASEVAAEAAAIGATGVYTVSVPSDFPHKWDLADAMPDGFDPGSLETLLRAAKPSEGGHQQAGADEAQSKGEKQPGGNWKEPKPLPSGLAKVAAFDADLLPSSIRPWVSDIADRMQCPPDFVGVSAMVGLAAVLGRKIAVKPQAKTDWAEVPNLWGCIVGRPGAMKSPAMNEALKPINRIEAEARKANEADMAAFRQKMMLHKVKVEVAQAKAKEAMKKGSIVDSLDIEEPEAPTPKRLITNDSTYEALGAMMAANPNGVLVFRDELISLLKTLDREEYAAARGFYLSAWNGTGGYTFDRIVRGLTHVDAVCASVLGSTQPGRLAEYLSRAVGGAAGDDGLIQRFSLLVWPDDNGTWKEVDRYPDSAAKEQAWSTFMRLDRLTPSDVDAEQDSFDHIPYLRFTEAGRGTFSEWRGSLEVRLKTGGLHSALESHLAKYRTLVPALALINHLADSGCGPIGEEAVLRSLAFAEYLETHAKRAYGSGSQTEVATATTILARIRKGDVSGEFTARDILQKDWSNLNNKDQVVAGLDLLDDLDWISGRDLKTGGRPKTIYSINPRAMS